MATPAISHDVLARRHANSLQPISRLPTEMLVKIFTHTEDFELRDKYMSYRWIKILHVCHLWYTIGICHPTLWTTVILTGGPECLMEMLARSRGLPLDIYTDYGYDDHDFTEPETPLEMFGPLLAEIHRTRTFAGFAGDEWQLMEGQSQSAGIMEELVLWKLGDGDLDLSKLFKDGFPALRDLQLGFDYFSGNITQVPNLRALTLWTEDQWDSDEFPVFVNVPNLLRSLEQMPLLQDVTLRDVLPQNFAGDPNGRVVDLPSITSFILVDSTVKAAHFLDLISIPTDAYLVVQCSTTLPSEIPVLASSLKRKFTRRLPDGHREERVLRDLAIRDESDIKQTLVTGYTQPSQRSVDGSLFHPLGSQDPNFELSLLYPSEGGLDAYVKCVKELLKTLPLSRVSVLETEWMGKVFFPPKPVSTPQQHDQTNTPVTSSSEEPSKKFAEVREVLPNVTSLCLMVKQGRYILHSGLPA